MGFGDQGYLGGKMIRIRLLQEILGKECFDVQKAEEMRKNRSCEGVCVSLSK